MGWEVVTGAGYCTFLQQPGRERNEKNIRGFFARLGFPSVGEEEKPRLRDSHYPRLCSCDVTLVFFASLAPAARRSVAYAYPHSLSHPLTPTPHFVTPPFHKKEINK